MMISLSDIPNSDKFTVININLAPLLPEYVARASQYVRYALAESPDVLIIHGVDLDHEEVLDDAKEYGSVHVSHKKSSIGWRNATVIAPKLEIKSASELPITGEIIENGIKKQVELAPECLIEDIYHHGFNLRIYNFDTIDGVLSDHLRAYAAGIMIKDAYLKKVKNPDYKDALLVMGADLHATSDSESVRLIEGKTNKQGVPPSAWIDVWPELHDITEDGVTERMLDVHDSEIVIPSRVRPKRKSYIMTYGDTFGRKGSPLDIDLIGMTTMEGGIPFSNTYGLEMTMYVPLKNIYSSNKEKHNND